VRCRGPDERSDLPGLTLPKQNPACRFAHAGYKLTASARTKRRQRVFKFTGKCFRALPILGLERSLHPHQRDLRAEQNRNILV